MQSELDLLLGTAIDSLVKLEALLYLYQRHGAVHTPDEISARLRCPAHEVSRALEELFQAGLIDRFSLGSGKHAVYGPTEDTHVQALLALLHERYHRGPEARTDIVQKILRSREQHESTSAGDSS